MVHSVGKKHRQLGPCRGFTLIELLVVIGIIMVMIAIALPGYNTIVHSYRIRNDANNVMGILTVARMRAAADFARAKVSCDTTSNACTLTTRTSTAGAWPTTPNEPQKVYLSSAVAFSIPAGAPGAGNQSAASQGRSGQANPYFIEFNSRGLPIEDTLGSSVSDYAFYLTDPQYKLSMAVSVDIGGTVTVYSLQNGKWVKMSR
jgi:prepilin-type N-terminal cleavage/methylation domain-containing protein